MKHLLLFIFFLFSVNAEFEQVSITGNSAVVYEKADSDSEQITATSSQTLNIRLLEKGEKFSKISFYDKEDNKSYIGFIETSQFETETVDNKVKTSASNKISMNKVLFKTIREAFSLNNMKEFNDFLFALPETFETHALELYNTKVTIEQKELEAKKLSEKLLNFQRKNSTLTKQLNGSQNTEKKLNKNISDLTAINNSDSDKIDELKVQLSLREDERKEEVAEAQGKRGVWAAISAVVALVLGVLLNR